MESSPKLIFSDYDRDSRNRLETSGATPSARLFQDLLRPGLRKRLAGSGVACAYSLLLSAYMIIDKKRIGTSIRCSGP
jgi:hypothetical protein